MSARSSTDATSVTPEDVRARDVIPPDPRPVPQRIVSAATSLFARQGFENTSVAQIVEKAGVTKGAMYHYFSSKDDLLAQSYSRLITLQASHLVEIAGRHDPVTERLRAAVEDLVRTTLVNLEDATVFSRSLHVISSEVTQEMREHRRFYRDRFEQLIQEGIDTGELETDVPLDLIAYNFFGAIMYLTIWFRPGGPHSIEDVARRYANLLLASVT